MPGLNLIVRRQAIVSKVKVYTADMLRFYCLKVYLFYALVSVIII